MIKKIVYYVYYHMDTIMYNNRQIYFTLSFDKTYVHYFTLSFDKTYVHCFTNVNNHNHV